MDGAEGDGQKAPLPLFAPESDLTVADADGLVTQAVEPGERLSVGRLTQQLAAERGAVARR